MKKIHDKSPGLQAKKARVVCRIILIQILESFFTVSIISQTLLLFRFIKQYT